PNVEIEEPVEETTPESEPVEETSVVSEETVEETPNVEIEEPVEETTPESEPVEETSVVSEETVEPVTALKKPEMFNLVLFPKSDRRQNVTLDRETYRKILRIVRFSQPSS
ncbi:MAG: hypothetical protein J7647_30180, partial [Cyanobacteria bacterium SBLK]|nr:hypothetical protein [Cyanobacteria bacterium SBLK]